jgi:hypothetical protein
MTSTASAPQLMQRQETEIRADKPKMRVKADIVVKTESAPRNDFVSFRPLSESERQASLVKFEPDAQRQTEQHNYTQVATKHREGYVKPAATMNLAITSTLNPPKDSIVTFDESSLKKEKSSSAALMQIVTKKQTETDQSN